MTGSYSGLITVRDDTTGRFLRKWEIRTGKQLWEVKTGSARESLAISPNGSRLSSRGFNSVALWNAATGEPIHQLPAGGSSAVAFSANNKYLVTMDGEHVMILEAEGGQLLRTIDAIALCAAISPDSSRIVTAAARVLDIWDSNTGALQFEYGNEVNTQLISFTSDEMGVLIATKNGPDLWDITTGEITREFSFSGLENAVQYIFFPRWAKSC